MKLSVSRGAAVVGAAALFSVLVSAPLGAYAETGASAAAPAVEAPLEGYPTVASLAAAFANAAPGAVIVLNQDLTGTASDPAVAVRESTAVTLDLNGHTVKLTRTDRLAGIDVPPGSTLTVTDSDIDHTGHLIVEASGGAGIGASALGHPGQASGFGSIVIAGAKVDATSSASAAIGSAIDGGPGGDITITYNTVGNFNFGSHVTATSKSAAGIGGAFDSVWQGAITITGHSTVEATGGQGIGTAGIGGGPDSTIGTITINDADVTATGSGSGAGIGGGGGARGPMPPITITNSIVEAIGGPLGAGISAGSRGDGEGVPVRLAVTGRSVLSPSSASGVAIDLSAAGSEFTLATSELYIASGNSVTVPEGVTVVNDGGEIAVEGTMANHGTIRNINGGRVHRPERVSDNNTTITWDGNGGTAPVAETGPIFARTITDAGDVSFPVPVRAGYDYVGWYTQADGGTRLTEDVDLGGGGPKTITVYAAWAPSGGESGTPDIGSGAPPVGSGSGGPGGPAGSAGGATLAATGSGVAPWVPIGGAALVVMGLFGVVRGSRWGIGSSRETVAG
jgi:uncharacterized repeat protein (TIGR02543 family)